jgi:RES domain-containing protein
LYSSNHISLSVLELLAHCKDYTLLANPFLLSIALPDDIAPVVTAPAKLSVNWLTDIEYTRWIGDQFLQLNKSLVLQVPSAIIPQEYNYLVNPLHKDFKKATLLSAELLELDKRLLHA